MPTTEQIRQFLAGSVLPVVAGAAATWLVVHIHLLALFHVSANSVAGALTQLGVYAISAGLTWLTSHHILTGAYSPAARESWGEDL